MLLVTGAGCLGDQNNISGIQAIAGLQSLSSRQGDARQVRNVIHAYVYKYNHTTFENDIAILVLNQSLVLGEKVRAIRLRDPTWELPGQVFYKCWNNVEEQDLSLCITYRNRTCCHKWLGRNGIWKGARLTKCSSRAHNR